jgi:multiple sugar transport system permease protein
MLSETKGQRRQTLQRRLDRHAPTVLLGPAVLVLALVVAFPFLYSLVLSLHNWNLADRKATWTFVGLENYVAALTRDPFFWSAFKVTAIFLVGAVVTQMLLGLAIALLLNRQFRGQGLVRTIIMLPLMTTPVVVGLIWRFMYNPERGMVNYLLSFVGIAGPDWLGRQQTAMAAVILADVWEWTPFVALIVLAALQALPEDPYEAARIDGASGWQSFLYITLPLITPALLVAGLIRLMDAFKTFDLIYVLTLGGPGVSTQVLSLYTYKYGFKFFRMGYASALSYIMVFLIVVVANIFIIMTSRQRTRA